jgi:N-acylglucosamine 2-epimerase
MKAFALQYKNELLDNVLPFWLANSKDETNGGYFTCLDQTGKIFDTDKFIWLQGREVWMFSSLYNRVEQKETWLAMAKHGAEFLWKYGKDQQGDYYFSLTANGQPLIQPYNIFSDCFVCMAFAQYSIASGETKYADEAVRIFYNIIKRKNNWKGIYNKAYPGSRNLRNFSLPMILCNLALELEPIIGKEKVDEYATQVMEEVLGVFYKEDIGMVVENVNEDGSLSNSFEGRLLNPGHGIEAMWFIMDLAKRYNQNDIIKQCTQITLNTLNYSWDKEYQGIYYFLDRLGYPPQQLEWDQKLWWVHVESLVTLSKAYAYTKNEDCLNWFNKVHDYTWQHFKDKEHPEWFGYLNRQGQVLLPLKGGKWKGCFHVPRALYQVWKTLESL